jgi:hypothetical protein
MKIDVLNKVLEGVPGVRKDGPSWLVPEETELSFYIALPAEVLSITRISRAIATPDLLTLETAKGERFYFTHEVVAGLKVGVSDVKSLGRSAGFR